MTGFMDCSSRVPRILLADRTLYPMSSEDIQRDAAIHDGQRFGVVQSITSLIWRYCVRKSDVVTDKGTELRILLQTADRHDPSSTDAKGYLSCQFNCY